MIDIFVESAKILVGLLLGLCLPGYLLMMVITPHWGFFTKLLYGSVVSIMIDIVVGIGLGYNEQWAQVSGGLTTLSVYYTMMVITIVLVIIVGVQRLIMWKRWHA